MNLKTKRKTRIHRHINPLSDARRIIAREESLNDGVVPRLDLKTTQRKTYCDSQNNEIEPVGKRRKKANGSNRRQNDLSKAEQKARELWHKKTGAGYALFVDYYAGQPLGVITSNCDALVHAKINITSKASKLTSLGQGQSRAAKKRRKRRSKNSPNINIGNNRDNNCHTHAIMKSSSLENNVNELSSGIREALKENLHCSHIMPYLTAISKPLPLTFRLRHITEKTNLVEELSLHRQHVQPVSYDTTYKLIYQALPKTNLTKSTLGQTSLALKSLLIASSTNGSVARQEIGSMLPVIALSGGNHMKYGSKVLDMCASPGSKTLQALEVVASPPESQTIKRKPGRIVANDLHPIRLKALKNAIARSGVPSSLTNRIVYTNHDAATFPPTKSGSKFDCILADVPCCGDGTIRKDAHILPGWMPSIGNALHNLQQKILKRALELVKVNGVVAYSTCTLNPVEDEAVVASVLTWANRKQILNKNDAKDEELVVELLEWPNHVLPGFKRADGVSKWRVADYMDDNNEARHDTLDNADDSPKVRWYDTFHDGVNQGMNHANASMWPPEPTDFGTLDFLHLGRCIRLLPQDQDTGGFFLALLKKNKEF